MPYNKTSSCLELNLAAKLEIGQMMLKSSLTISLIAGILSLPNLGKAAQASTLTRKIEKTANNRSSLAISRINFNTENKRKTATFLPKILDSVGSVRTLIANLSPLSTPQKEYSANNFISNWTDAKLGSTSTGHKIANFDREFDRPNNSNFIFIDQKLDIPTTENVLVPTEHLSSILQQSTSRRTSSIPIKVANKERNKAINPSKPNSDRHTEAGEVPDITKSKTEIEQLRRKQRLPQIQTVSVATSVPISNSRQNLLLKDSIALQLPPLPPADEYLPTAFDGYIWPTQGILTSGYGWRWGRMHRGIDIAAPIGTPIVAAASGEVITVGWQSGYGNVIKLEHLDGSVTVYGHNHTNLVSHGQKVEQGEQIAEMGNTGRSTGPHLHFEIRLAGESAIDPLALLGDK
jgi:murein DD-endopeptidase MepM/ murein hydrolase activator NlpD